MNVSVAMAVYNGEKYLKEQIDSIMCQLDEGDELIVSYNDSTDNTLQILARINQQYPSIKIFQFKKKGVATNFENAILHCTKDFIFLSSQDDVWEPNKIQRVMEVFESDPTILTVMHNCEYVDSGLQSMNKDLFSDRHVRKGLIKNLLINGYQGNCMAFRKELIPFVTPMPETVEVHDQWIGIMSERAGHIAFLNEKLVKYRKYEGTYTAQPASILKKLKWRFNMGFHIFNVLNEKKMLKWYLQSTYAPEKRAKFDYAYGYENDYKHYEELKKASENKSVESSDSTESSNDSETMMYMVEDFKGELKIDEESDSKK